MPSAHATDDGAVDRAVSTAIAFTGHVSPTESLHALKKQAAEMKTAKKNLGSQIRNAKRKNKRLKEKAKNLSTEDLMTLWMAKGGGKQTITGAIASAPHTGTPSHPDSISKVLAANAVCLANSAPVPIRDEQGDVDM
jgi:hypothetical protein